MTQYPTPLEQQYGASLTQLLNRVATLEGQIAHLTSGPVAVTSTTHPASPWGGMEIFETDTGLSAQWTGTAWKYPPQLIATKTLTTSQPSVSLPVPAGPAFNVLQAVWSARSDLSGTATYMCVQMNGDTAAHYFWQINQVSGTAASGGGEPGALTTTIQVGTMAAATATAGYYGSGGLTIPNASGSTYKAVSAYSNSSQASNSGFSGTYGGLWQSTTAITSLNFFPLAGDLVAGSSISLYGWT